jgi:hypothetical protein
MTCTVVDHAAGERLERPIRLADIRTSHNPRRPTPELQDALAAEGFEGYALLELCHELALSEDPEDKAKFVALVEKYCSDPKGLVELAASRREIALQAVLLRSFRVKRPDHSDASETGYIVQYGIIAGERRVLAAFYNHAKHDDAPTVNCTTQKMTVRVAKRAALEENLQRRDMSELEVGLAMREQYEDERQLLRRKAAAAGEETPRFTFKKFCDDMGVDYQYARSREALTHLPEKLQTRLEKGTLGVTEGANIGRDIKSGKRDKDGTPKQVGVDEVQGKKNSRQRALTMKELQNLFDDSRGESGDFLRGLAAAMQLTLRQASKASDKRIREEEIKEAARQLRDKAA